MFISFAYGSKCMVTSQYIDLRLQFNYKSNNQCLTFKLNTIAFNVESYTAKKLTQVSTCIHRNILYKYFMKFIYLFTYSMYIAQIYIYSQNNIY